jgi:ABC-type molybdate transport system ATPase subunit
MLSKKSSRAVTVTDQKYRWSIAPDGQWVTLVVQDEQSNGQKLEIIIKTDVSSNKRAPTDESMRPVKPALVADLIGKGLQIGWQPKTAHPPLELTLNDNDDLEIRRGLPR